MKKNDIILIAITLVVALACFIGTRIWQKSNTDEDAVAVVTIDGDIYGEFPLSEDIVERIEFPDGSFNVLTVSEGYADVTEASCPDQICVHHNHIRYSGESIVCLPNKLVVEVKGGEDNGIDGSTY
ncbi:NusG domain II-containing protein [Butyrivibrio sp. CB08]|uniref:NusG domain II-containing protein n=1 Tax=Butyrivibrio sp. CB08 TaxID=2364879 RepID=UPI000EA9E364|nr:NusG domain II-containing protein [Butyrivibrio sp. CB08]RKM61196.1 NusG domain II-containing protein [Butyrivibrio sp. CB08]